MSIFVSIDARPAPLADEDFETALETVQQESAANNLLLIAESSPQRANAVQLPATRDLRHCFSEASTEAQRQ